MSPNEFEQIASTYYEALYRFAFSLTRSQADACDLTQQTFYIWATKGHQLRDHRKVKSWLFTTLHREFLRVRKHNAHFTQCELTDFREEFSLMSAEFPNTLDSDTVLNLLKQLGEPCRMAVILFYLNDHAYQEIAEILKIPLGTVRSRISRGIRQLRALVRQDFGLAYQARLEAVPE